MRELDSIEISATSVDDAIELALQTLGLERDEVDVEVIREPNEPDEHGFVSDEALVVVTPRRNGSPQAVRPSPRRQEGPRGSDRLRGLGSRGLGGRVMSPGERMRISQAGQETLSDLLHYLGVVASCRTDPQSLNATQPDAPIVLEVDGEDLGVLIGRRGDNLDALQYMLNVMVQRKVNLWPSLQVDVAGYRRRRADVLEGLARRMARRVAETQQPFTFEPMSPRERRIIHVVIQEDDRVTTESIGEGDERRVVIYPAQ